VSQMLSASSPRSCITTSTSPGSNMLDFSNSTVQQAPEVKNHHSDNSSEVIQAELSGELHLDNRVMGHRESLFSLIKSQ
jgi:hypothetical protein